MSTNDSPTVQELKNYISPAPVGFLFFNLDETKKLKTMSSIKFSSKDVLEQDTEGNVNNCSSPDSPT
jgi:hypothetical protein